MKKNKWTKKEMIWLTSNILIIASSAIIVGNINIVSLAAALLGVIYAICIMKNERVAFIYGIGNVTLIGISLFAEKAYSGAIYNLVYSLPMMIVGFIHWGKVENKKGSGIKKLSAKTHNDLIVGVAVAIVLTMFVLKNLGAENIALDATISVLGYIGIFLMTNKYIEQWTVWILSNLLNTTLWLILTIESAQNIPILLMWIVYTLNSVFGYLSWKKKYVDTDLVVLAKRRGQEM